MPANSRRTPEPADESPAANPARFRALVADDEAPARDRIRQMLALVPDFTIVGESVTGRQAVEAIRELQPDIVFLDVQMPELNGIQVCEEVGVERMPLVVFVTAYDDYALHAFDIHAVDYLLKPFDRERFDKALARIRERLAARAHGGSESRLAALLAEMKPVARPDRLAFRSGGRVVLLKVSEIDWVEADGNYVCLHTGSASHQLRETMAWIEDRLPADGFMRISRSAIVNLDRVRELQPLFHGDYAVILHNGSKLTLSRHFRERLEALLERR